MGEGLRYFRSDMEVNCGVVCLVSEGITAWNQSRGEGMNVSADGIQEIRAGWWEREREIENQREG